MVFYIVLLNAVLILSVMGYVIKSGKYRVILPILLFVISALRYDVGWDYFWYYALVTDDKFEHFNPEDLIYWREKLELLPKLLIDASYQVNFSPLFFIVTALIITVCIHKALKDSRDYYISMFVFFSYPFFYLDTLNIIRQWIAIAIVFYFSKYILEKKYFVFFIGVFIAFLFHSSALITLIFPVLYFIKVRKEYLLAALLGSIVFAEVIVQKLLELIPQSIKYIEYLNGLGSTGGKILYLNYLICLFVLILKDRIIAVDSKYNFYINLLVCGTLISVMFTSLGDIGLRSSMYFIVFILHIIPAVIETFNINHQRIIRLCAYCGFSFLFILYLYTTMPEYNRELSKSEFSKSAFIPYKIILNEELIKTRNH